MDFEKALSILQWHVGFGGSPSNRASECFMDRIQAIERGQIGPELKSLVSEILECLEAANIYLNGPIPSESHHKFDQVPRPLVTAVSELLFLCHEAINSLVRGGQIANTSLRLLQDAAWEIECGWGAVLDGDIDCIKEHVQLEKSFGEQ